MKNLYVDAVKGNDANNGLSPATPWKTLAKANAAVYPGDTVNLSGNFVKQVIAPARSGTASNPITYNGAGTATLDQPGFVGATPYVCYMGGRSYVVIDGVGFTNSAHTTSPVTNKGIVLRSSSHITFQNCSMSWMQMQLIGSSFCTIQDNNWQNFVASYLNGQPQTSGDMLALLNGSHDNEIARNNMSYGGHSLIEIGTGWGPPNKNNWIHDNVLDNPWYKNLILADDGYGTIIENNQLLNANSVPTLLSTLPQSFLPPHWPKDGKAYASQAVQFSGSNFIFRNNLVDNAVSDYAPIGLGARWYYGAGAPVSGALVQSNNNQIYGNTISNCKGAADFGFTQNYTPGKDTSVPDMTGNLIYDNTIINPQPTVYSWDGTLNYETIIFREFKGAPVWVGLNGNEFMNNTGVSSSKAYRRSYVNAAGATTTQVYTLIALEALDPANISGNS